MSTNNRNSNASLTWLPYLIFFLVAFVFFGFYADYVLYYQEKSSLFIFSLDYLYENLHQPGGFLIWLGKFFTAFYYNPVIGAILLSAFLTLTIILISEIFKLLTGKTNSIVSFIIGASLFFLQTDYRLLLFNILGILLALSFFLIAIKYRSFLKGWLSVLLLPLCFFAIGGFCWIFLLGMTLYLALNKENNGRIQNIACWLVVLVTFYLSKEFLFFQSGKTLLTFPFSTLNTGFQWILFLIVAGTISVLPVIALIRIHVPWISGRSELSINLLTSVFIFALMVLIGTERFDKKSNQYFHVEKLFYEGKYDEIVKYNTANPTQNLLTLFLNNIALCERDKLDDMLFHFPQNKEGKTLFLKWEMENEILDRGGYFYYTIGMINEAHRWAYENMVMNGHTPEGIKMLIKTELMNGNYEVASRYISLLKRTLFYRKDAGKFEKMLDSGTLINSDNELGRNRHTRIENDFFSITDNPYINLEMILGSDSLNRKAFEYKMAYMLLRKNFNGITHDLPRFEKLGFTRLPVHVEEAAIALSVSNKGVLPYTGNLQISKNTELRWNQYLSVLKLYGNDVKKAEPALKSRFGDTFWYYVFYK